MLLLSPCSSDEKLQDNFVTASSSSKVMVEATVDFDMDIRIFIDNGKCIFYPKEQQHEELQRCASHLM